MANNRDDSIELAFQLFDSRGPATAYAYMQRVGIEDFPPSFVYIVVQGLRIARLGREALLEYNGTLNRA